MKRNVFTDGNGSRLIMVEGMGAYAPVDELDELKRQIESIKMKYGDNWYDGFIAAKSMHSEGVDLDGVSDNSVLRLSEDAEEKWLKKIAP
ncbi:hypothetical protein [Vibrio phage vB_VpaM_XM1]